MERFPNGDRAQLEANVWAHSLTKLLATKCGKKRTSRQERIAVVKANVELLANLLKAIISRVSVEKTRKENSLGRIQVLSHRIFMGIGDIVRGLDKLTFAQAKELVGKCLRDDYSLIEQAAESKIADVSCSRIRLFLESPRLSGR